MIKQEILLLGAGGHTRACIDVIENTKQYSVVGLVINEENRNQRILDYPVIGSDADLCALRKSYSLGLVGVGQIKSSVQRERLYYLLSKHRFDLPVIVSPLAYVSAHATLGSGTIVMHGAQVSAGAHIGVNCIINSRALIEHDAIVYNHCHISTAAVLNGGVVVGEGSFVGSNATIRDGVRIGDRSLVGMGEVVTADFRVEK